jgi:hypothetical protein
MIDLIKENEDLRMAVLKANQEALEAKKTTIIFLERFRILSEENRNLTYTNQTLKRIKRAHDTMVSFISGTENAVHLQYIVEIKEIKHQDDKRKKKQKQSERNSTPNCNDS